MYKVKFGDSRTFHCWEEEFSSYTAAWVAFTTARQLNDPSRVALEVIPIGTFWCSKEKRRVGA